MAEGEGFEQVMASHGDKEQGEIVLMRRKGKNAQSVHSKTLRNCWFAVIR